MSSKPSTPAGADSRQAVEVADVVVSVVLEGGAAAVMSGVIMAAGSAEVVFGQSESEDVVEEPLVSAGMESDVGVEAPLVGGGEKWFGQAALN